MHVFRKFDHMYEGNFKCVQTIIIHSIPGSAVFGEGIFSVMSIKWNEKNKCPQNLMKHELPITLILVTNVKIFMN